MAGNKSLNDWIKSQHEFVMKHKYIVTPFGRVIFCPDASSDRIGIQNAAKRQSVNYPVQSSASDVGLICGNRIYYENREEKLKTVFLGMVHDSMEFDIAPGELIRVMNRIKHHTEVKIREDYPWILCPLKMDFSIGTSWGSAIEFDVKELTEDKVVMEGSAIRKDYRQFIAQLNKAYTVTSSILSEEEIKPEKWKDNEFIRDSVRVKFSVQIN